MNNQHQAVGKEEDNIPYSSYVPDDDADPAFTAAPDVPFAPYAHMSSWAPPSSATPLPYGPYYAAQVGGAPEYSGHDLRIYERRGYSDTSLNVSCPGPAPMAMTAAQYPATSVTFSTPVWSPGVTAPSVEYFGSPLGTGSLSFADSASASPVGQNWPANLTPMDSVTSTMGSSASLSVVAENYAPALTDSTMFAEESFDAVLDMPAGDTSPHDVIYSSEHGGNGKAKAQPHAQGASKSSSVERRKSSVGSEKSSSASYKKEGKRKTGSNQDSQLHPVHGPKLRTAARRHSSKTGHLPKPGESPEEQRARASHNKVEKEYRSRLNKEFELVIDVLPASQAAQGQSAQGKMSKADVIGNATATIQSLADEVVQLREKKRLMEERKKQKQKLENVQPS